MYVFIIIRIILKASTLPTKNYILSVMGRSKNSRRNKRDAKEYRERIRVKVIGDSHATENHFFESAFWSHLDDPKNSWYHRRFLEPDIDGQGGRRISQKPGHKCISVEEINEYLSQNKQKEQILILLVGTNNFRPPQLGKTSEVFGLFKQVVEHAKTIPKAHLIIIGMIPDPQDDHNLKDEFSQLNDKLSKMSIKKANKSTVTFKNVGNHFTNKGEIKLELYKDLGNYAKMLQKRAIAKGKIVSHRNKNIHLDWNGACWLTKLILNVMNTLPNNYFKV